jgi:DNA-binding CsgD family transcriptional regulator
VPAVNQIRTYRWCNPPKIGRAFGKPSSSIYFLVAPHGGIGPAQRRRSRLALTLAEREVISRGVTAHQSVRPIARSLGRAPSTVSREMSRNDGYDPPG